MKKILVTGAQGQLGSELGELSPLFSHLYEFRFASRTDFPLDDAEAMATVFAAFQPDYCINCAAYTAVDRAESDREAAMRTNGQGPADLAKLCVEHHTRLIHTSTDYVFDGSSAEPLKEDAPVNPVNFYGESKLAGEKAVQAADPTAIIIRTSWVYSTHGSNFVKTMVRLLHERSEVKVVNDQIGAPTYAADLAKAIMDIVRYCDQHPDAPATGGIYHYCNEGRISWYEFAVEIREMIGAKARVIPISSAEFLTAAKRPAFSLMDTTKIRNQFGVHIVPWKDSLMACLFKMQQFLA